jgi:dTDP-4-amino-4,6-dideoxygalactose transaminase
MIAPRHNLTGFLPFSSPAARYFYFARNAIWLSVKMLGLEGREILVPAYHHGVEIEALAGAGAVPRFYRVDERWEVDLEDVSRKLGPKTGALYLIHYAGFPGPAAELREMADRRGIPLFEDCALSLLSSDGTEPLGSTGDVAVFCLYKTLPVPNGGALVVNGDKPYSVPEPPPPPAASAFSHTVSSLLSNLELRSGRAGRWIRSTARGLGKGTVHAARIERVATGTQHFNRAHVDLGMSPLTKRIALAQDLAGIVERRRRNYFYLLGRLRDLAQPVRPGLPAGVCPLFFPVAVADKQGVKAELEARGIEAIDFWRDSHPACDLQEFPEVARLRRTVLEIPCHQDLDAERVARLADHVRAVLSSRRSP